MGITLEMNRVMPTRRRRQRRRRRRNRHRYRSIAKLGKRKFSPSQQDDDSQGAKRMRNSGMLLTKDIWRRIHCLMPMRDAACVACVSHAFLNSWLCYPNLTFDKDTLGLDEHVCETDFISKVDHILKRHSGTCVKTFKLEVPYELDVCDHVDRWLQFAITPAIEELTLTLYGTAQKYNFPCSLLSDGVGNSIRILDLGHCAFCPTIELGSWRSLKSRVRIIENKAPNVSSFYFTGNKVKLSLGEWLQVKKLNMRSSRIVRYARATLPSMMPNVETLSIGSLREVFNTPMLPTKFPYLKYLSISLIGLTNSPAYDYLSLVSFLAASPLLETFFLAISQEQAEQESIFGSSSVMRQIPEHRHEYLKSVTINGFCSAKSMVELTCHILENAASLEHLTLNTNLGLANRSEQSPGILKEVPKALSAIQKYIAGKVPSTYFPGRVGFRHAPLPRRRGANTRSPSAPPPAILRVRALDSLASIVARRPAMGMLLLSRLMPTRRPRRRRPHKSRRSGLIAKSAKRKRSHCQQDDDDSQGGKRMRNSVPTLPEDIWCHIHSLMPMRDAARVACVSRAFLSSWRCHPNLTFNERTLGLDEYVFETDFISKVDHILEKHSGIGVKTFNLQVPYELDVCDHVDHWLQFAITPRIEELNLMLYGTVQEYNFPCSLLSDGIANSIRLLDLGHCAFRPTVELGSWRSLKRLCLSFVHITGDELGCVLSNSFALEWLELIYCDKIASLKIPCTLQRLSYLKVSECSRMRVIESKAPKVSNFYFTGYKVKLSLGEWLRVKELCMLSSHLVCYACANLPSMMPNLETLSICSLDEVVNTPMLTTKFLYLKYLSISLSGLTVSPSYDYFSLVSFLDASPFLETFFLAISKEQMKRESKFRDSSHMRQIQEHRHEHLKSVTIIGFCSAKSLVELTCHILENAVSLECLTLNTTLGFASRSEHSPGTCFPMGKAVLMGVPKALSAIQTYIVGKVPSTVRLNVMEPCNLCNGIGH
uniref:F-box domain-containing protein n=1 Tax=Oryza meridionalis TaxID=40149 RepID=A0A0E0E8M5_9ORYZ